MIRHLALAGTAALALGAVAYAQPAAVSAPDFVKQAGASDKFEITEAKIARTRSHNPKVRQFAAKMIHDHTESTMKVKAAATKVMGHAPPPPMLMPEQETMISDLRAAPAAEFDRVYIKQQLEAHEQALHLMEGYAANGEAAPLKHVAEGVTPVVRSHIDMLKGMQGM